MAEIKYGDRTIWYERYNDFDKDEEGGYIEGGSTSDKWFRTYLMPYMNIIKVDYNTDPYKLPIYYLSDGSAFKIANTSFLTDWAFYPGDPKKCMKKKHQSGTCVFAFHYMPFDDSSLKEKYGEEYATAARYAAKRSFEPYKYCWGGTRNGLLGKETKLCEQPDWVCGGDNGGAYCTALIQLDGWKISDDYPYHVSF